MILVVGATGSLGGRVCRGLLERGEEVGILVREGSDYGALVDAGARPIVGDLKDPASLRRACDDARTVVTTANSAGRGGEDTTETVDLRGNAALVDAARTAGVAHFVFVSVLGATEDSPAEFVRAKALTERRIRESGMAYTIIQPNFFMDVWVPMLVGLPLQQGRPVLLVGRGDHRHSFVASADVASLAIACVGEAAASGRTLALCGPEALTWTEVVAEASRILGTTIEVEYVAPGTPLPGLPPVVTALAAALETYETVLDTSEVAREFGVERTHLRDFLRAMLTPAPTEKQ
ncbi:SDR family oxidoreductase [Naasia sp. SYSU D00948]|uniref:SDR family oxidoreductase n=1 Tax=Naasia sp. SYSU D00948 TaxID=2817379 RepID=UPI001B304427|nr:SDR family oxidoreductase [Naasia sp. SYSU D00948]